MKVGELLSGKKQGLETLVDNEAYMLVLESVLIHQSHNHFPDACEYQDWTVIIVLLIT